MFTVEKVGSFQFLTYERGEEERARESSVGLLKR